ncbi:hypothetical protein BELL_0538g00010 [Botrytis elliptica]|uniref:Uncharacterized protein n=1 Tax=Botrytis elliptica TaxID=278938 RepID=A0A4Z1JDF7_9HELO|nr:hypothetical protein BELL_0538g00010 [Botrytis elliptica]
MRCTSGRGSWTNIVGDEGLGGGEETGGVGGVAGLDPVEDGTEKGEGGEGRVQVEHDEEVGGGGGGGWEGK